MTDETTTTAAAPAEEPSNHDTATDPAAEQAQRTEAAATESNFGADEDNFGAGEDNFGGFEDNFDLGEQQQSVGTIQPPPSATPKKPAETVRKRAESDVSATMTGHAMPAAAPAEPPQQTAPDANAKPGSKEEQLFKQFGLLHVPPKFCDYSLGFRLYMANRPTALKTLEPLLADEASVNAVRLGLRRIQAFPTPEFRNVVFYYPLGMTTESERKDWEEHLKKRPEYEAIAKGKFPYFDPPQFFYKHGAIYLDKAVTDRLSGGVFYQCGAFCGASAIVMSQFNPAKIYAFEPSVGNQLFLRANVTRANLKTLEMYQIAIGDKPGKLTLNADRDKDGKPCRTQVPLVPLDLFEEKKAVQGRVAWIQADVGGAGLRVVKGAEKIIKRDKPLLTIGIYHHPEEFFETAPLLHEWVPEYKFLVRRCQCNPGITYSGITLIAYIP